MFWALQCAYALNWAYIERCVTDGKRILAHIVWRSPNAISGPLIYSIDLSVSFLEDRLLLQNTK
jgi:hypothetical protein